MYIGTALNNALRSLIAPKIPDDIGFDEMKKLLIDYFDCKRNKYAESVKLKLDENRLLPMDIKFVFN